MECPCHVIPGAQRGGFMHRCIYEIAPACKSRFDFLNDSLTLTETGRSNNEPPRFTLHIKEYIPESGPNSIRARAFDAHIILFLARPV